MCDVDVIVDYNMACELGIKCRRGGGTFAPFDLVYGLYLIESRKRFIDKVIKDLNSPSCRQYVQASGGNDSSSVSLGTSSNN